VTRPTDIELMSTLLTNIKHLGLEGTSVQLP